MTHAPSGESCGCKECNPPARWTCGGVTENGDDCLFIVEGGKQEQLQHQRTAHPHAWGMLWLKM